LTVYQCVTDGHTATAYDMVALHCMAKIHRVRQTEQVNIAIFSCGHFQKPSKMQIHPESSFSVTAMLCCQ